MKKRISQIGIHKTSLTIATLTVAIMLPFILLALIPAIISGEFVSMIVLVVAPLFYFIFGYIFMALWCWVYNMITKKTKLGFVITLDDIQEDKSV